jgi:hypothetical protein
MIIITYMPSETRHAVHASGGPEDGSLYGFVTLCNLKIDDLDKWSERGGTVSCGNCKRVIRAYALQAERQGHE